MKLWKRLKAFHIVQESQYKTTFGYPKIFGVSYILERKIGINLC